MTSLNYFQNKKLLNPECLVSRPLLSEERINLADANILILGQAGHGKDTFAKCLCEASNNILTSCSSSWFMAERVMREMAQSGYKHYSNLEACYYDRNNHRSYWFNVIRDYNEKHGLHHLAKELTSEYNIYTGMRNPQEYIAALDADIFNIIFYVDAEERVGNVNENHNTIELNSEMLVISNDNDLADLQWIAQDLLKKLFIMKH